MLTSLLLNWRVLTVIGLIAANAISYSAGHHRGYESGRAEVQTLFDAYREDALEKALAAQVATAAKEHAMTLANEKVSTDYESLQTATSLAVRSLDADRVRLQAALSARRGAASSNPQAGLPPDAGPEVGILSECLARYEAVAGDADQLSGQVKALQDYVNNVVEIK